MDIPLGPWSLRFELLGPITQIEAFVVGSRIREIVWFRKFYGEGVGENVKVSRAFDFPMASSISLRFIGRKQRGWAGRDTRSNDFSEFIMQKPKTAAS